MLLSVPFKIAMNCGVDHPPVFFLPGKNVHLKTLEQEKAEISKCMGPILMAKCEALGHKDS